MKEDQTREIMNRLVSAYTNIKFEGEIGSLAKKEYIKPILKLDYKIMSLAVDEIIKTIKFFPAVSEIIETYNTMAKSEFRDIETEQQGIKCFICMDQGGMMVDIIHWGAPNRVWAKCDCPKGKKNYESCASISIYLDIKEMERLNRDKYESLKGVTSNVHSR